MLQSDPFTQSAQDAAMRALELMQHYGHSLVDTEHLCLALVEQSEGTIPDILQVLDVDPATITQRLHQELPRLRLPSFISSDVDRVFITSRLKQIIDRSNQEAAKRKDDHISAEHLLLGIASEKKTAAARIMADVGLTRKRILEAMEKLDSTRETAVPPSRKPLPNGLAIETVAGENPELVLSQGDHQVRIPLRDTQPLIAALAEAAAALATAQAVVPETEEAEPTE